MKSSICTYRLHTAKNIEPKMSDRSEPTGARRELSLVFVAIVLAPFAVNDLLFIASETDVEWLAADYGCRIFVLAVIAAVPSFRACVRSSLGPMGRPGEIPSLTWIRVVAYTSLTITLFVYVDAWVHYPLWEYMPELKLFRYPEIEIRALYYFDLTFGLALVAVSEEFACRAIMKQAIERFTTNRLVIVLISSVIFGLFHWSHGVSNVAGGFVYGVVFMMLYLSTGSVLPSMVSHYFVNLIYFTR